jgi:hypothetical protein
MALKKGVNSPGQYGRTFVEAMSYRKGEKAELGTEKANKMKSYKSQHDQSQPDKSLLMVRRARAQVGCDYRWPAKVRDFGGTI